MTIEQLERPFKPSFLDWLRAYGDKTGMTYRAALTMAWRMDGLS